MPPGCLAANWRLRRLPDRSRTPRRRKVAVGLTEQSENEARKEFREKLIEAFVGAYPDMHEDDARHSARNLAQVLSGVVDIGEKAAAADEITHMDVANAFVYWCVANTELEAFFKRTNNGSASAREAVAKDRPTQGPEDMEKLLDEFVARAADLLIGLQVLSESSELYQDFVRGSAVIGAYKREKNRGKIGH